MDYQLGALDAWRVGHIERGTVAAVVASRHFRDGVGLGMEHVWVGVVGLVLTNVVKARRSAVEPVGDNHFVLDQQRAHLAAPAI